MIEEFVNLRKSLGWTQGEAARQVGSTHGTVQSHELKRRDNYERLLTLAMRRLAEHPEERLPPAGDDN